MSILKRELAMTVTGSLGDKDDWWDLCYDTDTGEFFVEHRWSHMNAYKLSAPVQEGQERMSVESFHGPGYQKIEALKAELLAEANGA